MVENEVADKPSNVERTSGSVVWLKLSNLFKFAGLIVLLGCLYQGYTDFSTTMERRFQEIILTQENSEKNITNLAKTIIELNGQLTSLSKEKQRLEVKLEKAEKHILTLQNENIDLNGKLRSLSEDMVTSEKKIASLGKDNKEFNTTLVTVSEETRGGLSKTNMFLKEFYKNFTLKNTLMDKHDTAIQYIYNFSNNFNEKLTTVKNEQTQMLISINQRLDARQGCQSGYDVGGDSYPEHAFPSARTVQFNPPFKSIPALSYGTTMLDTTSRVSLRLELLSLTAESFTVHFHTWGKYALYAAKFSWMACPK